MKMIPHDAKGEQLRITLRSYLSYQVRARLRTPISPIGNQPQAIVVK